MTGQTNAPLDQARWSGNCPLPAWWDGVSLAEDAACATPWTDADGWLARMCTRPDGHTGRHMAAHTAGLRPAITHAWPGADEPTRDDVIGRTWRYLWIGRWFVGYYHRNHDTGPEVAEL